MLLLLLLLWLLLLLLLLLLLVMLLLLLLQQPDCFAHISAPVLLLLVLHGLAGGNNGFSNPDAGVAHQSGTTYHAVSEFLEFGFAAHGFAARDTEVLQMLRRNTLLRWPDVPS